MLEDLKKEAASSSMGSNIGRLSAFVAACVVVTGFLVLAQTCSDWQTDDSTEKESPEAPGTGVTAPARIPPSVLLPLITEEVTDADGGTRTVESVDAYAPRAIEWMRLNVEGEPPSSAASRVSPVELQAVPRDEALGQLFEVAGKVVERTEQRWGTGSGRLWNLVVADDAGNQVLTVTHALATDVLGGAPRNAYFGGGSRQPIREGERVLVRGYFLQRRTGTVGEMLLPKPTPVIWATTWRRMLPAGDRVAPLESLEDVDWDGVRDRLYAETTRWDEPQLYEVVQWARSVGHDEIARLIDTGELDVEEWNQDTFAKWQPEVDVKAEQARAFTEGSRGRWFKTSGLISSWVHEGWNRIPANQWGVDNLLVLDIMSDHYGNWTIRSISAFPISTYEGVKAERAEHVWLYGVFFKNHSYETRWRSETGTSRPLTMPMFIVLHVEPRVYGEDVTDYRQAMGIIAAVIVALGILFYVLFVRGERTESKREAERVAKRRARRDARGEAVDGPSAPEDASPDEAPTET